MPLRLLWHALKWRGLLQLHPEHDYRFVAYKVCVLLYAQVLSAIMRYLMTKTTLCNICVYMYFHTKGGYSYLNFSSVELNPTVCYSVWVLIISDMQMFVTSVQFSLWKNIFFLDPCAWYSMFWHLLSVVYSQFSISITTKHPCSFNTSSSSPNSIVLNDCQILKLIQCNQWIEGITVSTLCHKHFSTLLPHWTVH